MTSFSFETRVGKKGLIRVPQLAKLENKMIRIKFDIEDVEEENPAIENNKTQFESPFMSAQQAIAFIEENSKTTAPNSSVSTKKAIENIQEIVDRIKAKGETCFLTVEEMNEYEHQQIMKGIQL
jgi:predicted nuclease with TOPRIM domain